ncbi:MAG: hypothetical protein IJJ71_08275 [Treponema sp.]|uniref:alpha-amylase family glycosyl hydrolase n=1 Tax=Treponema sp. TaxID=166 RepID=UPI0025EDE4A1|nr:alpha-amylase family glycosyl hydrolase [Treponema sp.]MBR0496152.1 hypothetical protein [Treponema sp.]
MKKCFKRFAAFLCAATLLFSLSSCKSGDDDNEKSDNNGGTSKSMKIALYGADTSKTWNVWAWKEKGSNDENYDTKKWPGGTYQLSQKDANGCVYLNMNIDTSVDLGILFVSSSGTPQTGDIIVPKNVLSATQELYFTYATMNYYTKFSDMAGIKSAQITSADCNTIEAKIVASTAPAANEITVKDKDGAVLSVTDVSLSGITATITITGGAISKIPYTVTYSDETVTTNIKNDLIDDIFSVNDSEEFGVKVSGSTASFNIWAPLASKVQLALYADSTKVSSDTNATLKEMFFDSTKGNWTASNVDITGFKYYKYAITNNGKTVYVCDIWAKAASADSVASQICEINSDSEAIATGTLDQSYGTKEVYKNPFTGSDYSEAVIYEMHIRDWSRAVVSDSKGKFLDIANSSDIINYLKDLGVTHVQILPMFDYAQTNSDTNYNWGYNLYHYNVPEGRYVTENYIDGTQAVKEMRQMISALHDAGIAVIMDVVYNHTSGTGNYSLYDKTIPQYFYRTKSDGSYSNGSGCGNEIATNHKMVKKYVVDSLKHWMLDYHINGFRFDLMGCIEASTMKEIYDELYKIDPKVMVYGEPWTGGDSSVVNGAAKAGKASQGSGYGAFDDDFRDAIKGGEFGGFALGQIQGNYANETNLLLGLCGKQITKNNRNTTGLPSLALHYAECHDNYTLFDKLVYSTLTTLSGDLAPKFEGAYNSVMNDSDKFSKIKNQVKLAGAYILLSQGTPFLNGGQEFLRTKKGNPDSYAADKKGGISWTNTTGKYNIDDVNTIDLDMKTTNADVYNTYKGLIALRKANKTVFGANTNAKAEKIENGFTKYFPTGEGGDFLIYFNATDEGKDITTTGYGKFFDVSSGTPTENTTIPTSIPAQSFVILKK